MKKLLTIVAVALLLCLSVSAALAITYGGKMDIYQLEDALNDSTFVLPIGLGSSEEIKNLVLVDPSLAELKTKIHGKAAEAHVKGESVLTGKFVTVAITIEAEGHWWDVVEEEFNDCTKGGYRVWACTYPGCTASYKEELPAKPHVYKETNTATCTKGGNIVEQCNVCGKQKVDALGNPVFKKDPVTNEVIKTDALGHLVKANATKWTYNVDIKCNPDTQRLKDGTAYVVCDRCKGNIKAGETTYDADGADRTAEIDPIAIDQDNDALKVEAIRALPGLSKWDIKSAHSWHKDPYKVFEPTCTLAGGKTFYCDVCGWTIDEYDAKSKPLGHLYAIGNDYPCEMLNDWSWNYVSDVASANTYVEWTCGRCGQDVTAEVTVTDINYTATGALILTATDGKNTFNATIQHTDKVDSIAGYELDSAFYGYHWRGNLAEINAWSFSEEQLIAWCEEGQIVSNVHCLVCGRNDQSYKDLGHDWSDWKLDMEAGTGKKVFKRICNRCDSIQVKTAADVPCADDAHVWEVKDPTKLKCKDLNAGTTFICTVCGLEKVGEYPIADHVWEEIAVIKAATCTEAGSHVVRCANPGCKEYDTQDIPALGHKLTLVEEVPATCKDTGTAAYYVCDVCELKFSDAEGKTKITAPAVLAKTDDHKWDDGVVTVEATVEKVGEKTFTCTVCGKTKTEEIAKKPAPAEYKLEDVKYTGNILSGKLTHTEGALAEKLSIRVTFFLAGNIYMTNTATIYADGTFEAEGAGEIEAITLVAYAAEKVVNPADVEGLTKLDAKEIIVK